MSTKKIPFTPEKYEEMQNRFRSLKKEREEVMQRLITAREMGDLSENGAYKYAKFELGNIKRELRKLRQLLQDGYPAKPKAKSQSDINQQVDFGSSITLTNLTTNKDMSFTLVSEHESDPIKGKLSLTSPIGSAVKNAKEGETITVKTPKGDNQYLIKKIT